MKHGAGYKKKKKNLSAMKWKIFKHMIHNYMIEATYPPIAFYL